MQFSGLWHDIDIYPSAYQQGHCNNILYALNVGAIDVLGTQVINQTLDSSNALATVSTADGTGKLQVHFSGVLDPSSVNVRKYENYLQRFDLVSMIHEKKNIIKH